MIDVKSLVFGLLLVSCSSLFGNDFIAVTNLSGRNFIARLAGQHPPVQVTLQTLSAAEPERVLFSTERDGNWVIGPNETLTLCPLAFPERGSAQTSSIKLSCETNPSESFTAKFTVEHVPVSIVKVDFFNVYFSDAFGSSANAFENHTKYSYFIEFNSIVIGDHSGDQYL